MEQDERPIYSDTGSCIVWDGPLQANGYGRASRAGGKSRYAHRRAYEDAFGPVAAGLDLDHLCRNRACINPLHLEPVTRQVNLLRGDTIPAKLAARTHCKRGHELGGDNVPRHARGRDRTCLACAKIRCAAKDARRKERRFKNAA